jgi:hypothetical protein
VRTVTMLSRLLRLTSRYVLQASVQQTHIG